jgi:hypothetical protein
MTIKEQIWKEYKAVEKALDDRRRQCAEQPDLTGHSATATSP